MCCWVLRFQGSRGKFVKSDLTARQTVNKELHEPNLKNPLRIEYMRIDENDFENCGENEAAGANN